MPIYYLYKKHAIRKGKYAVSQSKSLTENSPDKRSRGVSIYLSSFLNWITESEIKDDEGRKLILISCEWQKDHSYKCILTKYWPNRIPRENP